MLTCGDPLSVQLLCILCFKIWLAQNLLMYQQKTSEPVYVAEEAFNCVMDFNSWSLEFSAKKKLEINREYNPRNVHIL